MSSSFFFRMLRVACLGDSLTKGNESLYDGGPKPRALRLLGNYPRVLASLLPLLCASFAPLPSRPSRRVVLSASIDDEEVARVLVNLPLKVMTVEHFSVSLARPLLCHLASVSLAGPAL